MPQAKARMDRRMETGDYRKGGRNKCRKNKEPME